MEKSKFARFQPMPQNQMKITKAGLGLNYVAYEDESTVGGDLYYQGLLGTKVLIFCDRRRKKTS